MSKVRLITIILFFGLLFTDPFEPLNIDFLKKKSNQHPVSVKKSPPPAKKKAGNLPAYEEIIKDFLLIDGLFSIYWDKEKNKFLMSIKPNQLDEVYLANLTRTSGDGMYYDSGSMLWEFPFIFSRLSNTLQLIHINTDFRADQSSAIYKSIQNNLSNSIFATAKIISSPSKDDGAILIDATEMFVRDIGYVSQQRKGKYRFDRSNSYASDLQSYPHNTEIEITAHFISPKWTDSFTLPNSHSMTHVYHISLSAIPETDFSPRLVDDRIGYFSTIYQDYTSTLKETPYVRYINRWDLQKKHPEKSLSEPIKPIVFWLENTIPIEFRPAVREGVLAWNQAFEKIGFKNALVVKQMPDDATWHPGDARYNTIRWIVQPGSGYAVGPSRANPYTGELYDADIRISADFTRAFYREFDEFVHPVIDDNPITLWEEEKHNHAKCEYADNLQDQMILAWHSLTSQGYVDDSPSNLQEYIHDGLVDLVLHEVGHTLGLRHNFKASSVFSIEDLSNPDFTNHMGISGSVMDYHPVSLLDNGNTMFQTQPGPYDDWAIAYGYTVCSNHHYEEDCLESIASQSNNPLLVYGTDEDAFGLSSRGIDPLCNTWDIGGDPILYYSRQLDLVQKLWDNLLDNFEKKGNRFQKIRSVFSQGIWEYYSASRTAAKFIGGIHFSRNHIGDPNQKDPLIVVDPDKQREALYFINNRIFNKEAFQFDENILNKLPPERYDDFTYYVWRLDRIDYPIHTVIKRIQRVALYSIFHPRRILRLQDNELRYRNEDQFTMAELFNTVNSYLWNELNTADNINSYRRELQKTHINLLRMIMLDMYDYTGFPNDAKTLARANLKRTLQNIYHALSNNNLDQYTRLHLENCSEDIESTLEARINFN